MTDLEREKYTEFFNTCCAFCKRKIKDEEEKKKDLYIDYHKFIEMCAKLVKELGIPYNSISASYVIALLTKYGWFSVDNNFKYDNVKDGLWEKAGFYVVGGTGCCRHIADFANDIYSELGINSIPFSCYVGNDIPSSILDDNANHLANLIYYEGMPYIYDLQNYSILRFISDKTAFNKNLDIKYYTFEPNYMGINYDVDVSLLDKLMHDFYSASKKSGIKEKDLWEIERKTYDNFFKNLDLILDFSMDTKVLKKEISSKISVKK